MAKMKPVVGGQALIEGVLMRNGTKIASALRNPQGEIEIHDYHMEGSKNKLWTLPILRGIYALGQSMKMGIKVLNDSASVYGSDEESAFDRLLEKHFGEKAESISLAITMMISLSIAVLFFMVLPTLLISFLRPWISSQILLSFFEGLLKMSLFIAYIFAISRLKDIHRVFMYHGAEHKAVYTYESGQELTVENAKTFSRLHPRCGTSYVFFVLALSILVFSLVSWTHLWLRVGLKLLFLPLVAGLGYELLRFSAKESPFLDVLKKPGLYIQRITTAEPDDDQLEVALAALKRVVDEN